MLVCNIDIVPIIEKFKDTKSFEQNLHTLVDDVESYVENTLNQQCLSVLEGFIAPQAGFVKTTQQGFNDFMLQVRNSLEELWTGLRNRMLVRSCVRDGVGFFLICSSIL